MMGYQRSSAMPIIASDAPEELLAVVVANQKRLLLR